MQQICALYVNRPVTIELKSDTWAADRAPEMIQNFF